jgi:hypothetical protein
MRERVEEIRASPAAVFQLCPPAWSTLFFMFTVGELQGGTTLASRGLPLPQSATVF